jgi:hypothetical protein
VPEGLEDPSPPEDQQDEEEFAAHHTAFAAPLLFESPAFHQEIHQ